MQASWSAQLAKEVMEVMEGIQRQQQVQADTLERIQRQHQVQASTLDGIQRLQQVQSSTLERIQWQHQVQASTLEGIMLQGQQLEQPITVGEGQRQVEVQASTLKATQGQQQALPGTMDGMQQAEGLGDAWHRALPAQTAPNCLPNFGFLFWHALSGVYAWLGVQAWHSRDVLWGVSICVVFSWCAWHAIDALLGGVSLVGQPGVPPTPAPAPASTRQGTPDPPHHTTLPDGRDVPTGVS